jgi:hypothetical protein
MPHVRLKNTYGARPKMSYLGVAEQPFGDLGRSARVRRVKRKLILEAQALTRAGESTDWKAASQRMHQLHERWKRAGSAGEEYDDKLWKRFKKAGAEFRSLRDAHYAELERRRRERVGLKESLLSEARELSSVSDFDTAKGRLTDFMHRWREIGHTGSGEGRLWEQFVAARQAMYDATAEDRNRRQADYVQRVHERIHHHREVIGKLRSQRRELMLRRRAVVPGWVGIEMTEEFDQRIEDIDRYLGERQHWVEEDEGRLAKAAETSPV